jgi:hypothetical protein
MESSRTSEVVLISLGNIRSCESHSYLYIPTHHSSIVLNILIAFGKHTTHLNSQRQQWQISNRTGAGFARLTTYHGSRHVNLARELHYQLETKTARGSNGKSTLLATFGLQIPIGRMPLHSAGVWTISRGILQLRFAPATVFCSHTIQIQTRGNNIPFNTGMARMGLSQLIP